MNYLRLITLGLAFSSLFLITSCEEEPMEPVIVDIVQTAIDTDELSSLVTALQQVDLVSVLEGDGPFTVFAPNNAAFQDLLDTNADWNTLADIDNTTLTSVLLYHVLGAKVQSADLTDSYVTTASTGPNDEQITLQIDVTGGVKFNGTTEPITTDIEATNGVIHIVDQVMLPPTVVNHALNNPQFSSLVAALTRSDLNTMYADILVKEGPFTVFAPTNAAFQALLDTNTDWTTLADIPVAVLETVLNYHVIQNANVQSDQLTDGQVVGTLGGQDLTIDLSTTPKISTVTGQSVDIAITDVQGSNGVVHAISAVLIPVL